MLYNLYIFYNHLFNTIYFSIHQHNLFYLQFKLYNNMNSMVPFHNMLYYYNYNLFSNVYFNIVYKELYFNTNKRYLIYYHYIMNNLMHLLYISTLSYIILIQYDIIINIIQMLLHHIDMFLSLMQNYRYHYHIIQYISFIH